MKNCILTGFADEIDPMMQKQYALLHRLGIEYIELRGVNGKNISKLTEAEVSLLKSELDREKIKISAIGSPLGKIKITDDFEEHFAMLEKLLSFAKILDTRYIRVFSFYMDGDYNTHKDEVFKRMSRFIDAAAKVNVVLLHENEKGIYGDNLERCVQLMERFYGDSFKCTFDFANFVQCGVDTVSAYKALRPYIEYIHIKDALYDGGHVVPPGMGDGRLKDILNAAFSDGYHGFLSLEPHLSNFHGLDKLEKGEIDKKDKIPGETAFTTAYNALIELLEQNGN